MIQKGNIIIQHISRMVYRTIVHYKDKFIRRIRMKRFRSVLRHKLKSDNISVVSFISDSLFNLRDLGAKTTLSKEEMVFEIAGSRTVFPKPEKIWETYAILELFYQSRRYDFDIYPGLEPRFLTNYLKISDNILETYSGIKFHLGNFDPYVLIETFINGIHGNFPDVGKTILDIVEAFGYTPLYFASQGERVVIAIEPMNFDQPVSNGNLNPDLPEKIIPLRLDVGKSGVLGIIVQQKLAFDGNSGVKRKGSTQLQVPSRRLKEIIKKAGINSVDILKSDCKSCEKEFTLEDFSLVKNAIEIGCSSDFSQIVSNVHKTGFRVSLRHYDSTYAKPLNVVGKIIGIGGDTFE